MLTRGETGKNPRRGGSLKMFSEFVQPVNNRLSERRLTTPRSGDIARARKKRVKFSIPIESARRKILDHNSAAL